LTGVFEDKVVCRIEKGRFRIGGMWTIQPTPGPAGFAVRFGSRSA
jgi:hypothetical protein